MRSEIQLILIAVLNCIVHELGHHYFKRLSGYESKIRFRGGFRFGMYIDPKIPDYLRPEIKDNPSKFTTKRVQISLAGIVGIFPSLIFSVLLPDLQRWLNLVTWLFVVHTIWETATRDYPYLNQLYVES